MTHGHAALVEAIGRRRAEKSAGMPTPAAIAAPLPGVVLACSSPAARAAGRDASARRGASVDLTVCNAVSPLLPGAAEGETGALELGAAPAPVGRGAALRGTRWLCGKGAAASVKPGDVLAAGKYELREMLARGSMGSV